MTTVNKTEIEKFSKMAKDWWNPNGKFKPLHLFNPARIAFIREKLISYFKLDANSSIPLKKLKILDIGCGGGLLCEPLNRLGATVTGIDPSSDNIEVAKLHSEEMNLSIEYIHCPPENINLEKVKNGTIIHLPTGIEVTLGQMIDAISGSRVIYVGETHDNLEAHRVQLDIIKSLMRSHSGHIAIGMEMFRRSAQDDLDLWIQGSLSDSEFKNLFFKHWGGDFRLYQNIFEYIYKHQIPLIGLKSTEEAQISFKQNNTNSALEPLPEIDENDKYHKAHSMSVFGGHGDNSPENYSPYRTLLPF